MMKWEQIGKTVKGTGETIIQYGTGGSDIVIESRKEAVPHANRSGVWFHTSYFVIRPDGTELECYRLSNAKAAAERLMEVANA